MHFLGKNDLSAYLVMMAEPLVELHRVLKPTGSLYLHCDPTASLYLKAILDTIFGPRTFETRSYGSEPPHTEGQNDGEEYMTPCSSTRKRKSTRGTKPTRDTTQCT